MTESFWPRANGPSSPLRGELAQSRRTNGFVERMDRTLFDKRFRVMGRTTWYLEPE